jgi:arginyl-tRNA synthetase
LREKDQYGQLEMEKKETVVLDYSAPNIAKPLGVHHLLSTIIGQSLYNLFKHIGFKTISVNHIGDWGTQFGKLIYAYRKWGNEEAVKKSAIKELLKLYIKFHDESEKNPEIEEEGRKEFKKIEEGDEENKKLWEWFVEESLKEIEKTYKKLGGIHFDYTQGESFYQDKMDPILEDGKKKKIIEKGEEGAFVVHFEDEDIPTVPVQKKDGATLYITRDLATLKYRIENWSPHKVFYVVDTAQSMHFKQLFLIAERLGWYQSEDAEHISFGRMSMKDGSMSTRKGNVVLLEEVLDEAITRASKIIEEKNPAIEGKEKIAEVVGVGAVKYSILHQNRGTDITFDWDTMLSLDGNSAPYLLYTYARAKSILRKSKDAQSIDKEEENSAQIEEKTKNLLRALAKFKECLMVTAEQRKPNMLSNYLYELAQKFNTFYNSVPVLKVKDEAEKEERLRIVEGASQIIKNGLLILGIETLEEM